MEVGLFFSCKGGFYVYTNHMPTKARTVTIRIEECEHSGDIEIAMRTVRGCHITRETVCDGPEVGFVVVRVTDSTAFDASIKSASFASFEADGDDMDYAVAEEEGMHAHENGEDDDDGNGWD